MLVIEKNNMDVGSREFLDAVSTLVEEVRSKAGVVCAAARNLSARISINGFTSPSVAAAGNFARNVARCTYSGSEIKVIGKLLEAASAHVNNVATLRHLARSLRIPDHCIETALFNSKCSIEETTKELLFTYVIGERICTNAIDMLGAALVEAGANELKSHPGELYKEITQPHINLESIIFEVSKWFSSNRKLFFDMANKFGRDFDSEYDYSNGGDARVAILSLMRGWMVNTANDANAKNYLRYILLGLHSEGRLPANINAQAFKPIFTGRLQNETVNRSCYSEEEVKIKLFERVSERISSVWKLQSLANSLGITAAVTDATLSDTHCKHETTKKLLTDWFVSNDYNATRKALEVALRESGQSRLACDCCQERSTANTQKIKEFKQEDAYAEITEENESLESVIIKLSAYLAGKKELACKISEELKIDKYLINQYRSAEQRDEGLVLLFIMREWMDNTVNDAEAKNALRCALIKINPAGSTSYAGQAIDQTGDN